MMTTGVSKRQLKGDTRLSAVNEGRHKYRRIRILHTVLIQYNLKIGLLVLQKYLYKEEGTRWIPW